MWDQYRLPCKQANNMNPTLRKSTASATNQVNSWYTTDPPTQPSQKGFAYVCCAHTYHRTLPPCAFCHAKHCDKRGHPFAALEEEEHSVRNTQQQLPLQPRRNTKRCCCARGRHAHHHRAIQLHHHIIIIHKPSSCCTVPSHTHTTRPKTNKQKGCCSLCEVASLGDAQ